MAKSRGKKRAPGGEGGGVGEGPAAGPAPSLEDDAAALIGWWVLGRVARLLWVSEYSLRVYHLGADRECSASADFDLEDRGVARVLVELRGERLEDRSPLFEYRLQGDWLGLRKLPDADLPDYPSAAIWELEGAWFRLRFPEEAPPPAMAGLSPDG